MNAIVLSCVFSQAVSLQSRLTSDSLSSAVSLPRARITGALHIQIGPDTRKLLSFLSLTLPHYQCFHALWVIISYRPGKPQGMGERHDPILEKRKPCKFILQKCMSSETRRVGGRGTLQSVHHIHVFSTFAFQIQNCLLKFFLIVHARFH